MTAPAELRQWQRTALGRKVLLGPPAVAIADAERVRWVWRLVVLFQPAIEPSVAFPMRFGLRVAANVTRSVKQWIRLPSCFAASNILNDRLNEFVVTRNCSHHTKVALRREMARASTAGRACREAWYGAGKQAALGPRREVTMADKRMVGNGGEQRAPEEQHGPIFTFARTFSEAEHAKSFLRGHVRMQTIEHFRGLEATERALRGDAYEGLTALIQPSDISEIVVAGMAIPAQVLTAPVTVRKEAVRSWHVFCLHTVGVTEEDPKDYETLEDLRNVLLLDERSTQLGGHVVVLADPQSFLDRIHRAIAALGYRSQSQLVRCFDEVLYSGSFDGSEIPFRKGKRFAYQKEYRIVAKTPPGVGSPLVLELGDLSTIARLTTAEEFNASLTVEVKDRRSS